MLREERRMMIGVPACVGCVFEMQWMAGSAAVVEWLLFELSVVSTRIASEEVNQRRSCFVCFLQQAEGIEMSLSFGD